MGDGGAAAVLLPGSSPGALHTLSFAARSEHWALAQIRAGGSMYPRGDEYAYLSGDGPGLKDAFVVHGPAMLREMLSRAGLRADDFDRIVVHQVGVPYHAEMLAASGLPTDRVEMHVDRLGNLASASLPVGHVIARDAGRITAGQRVLWLGMASGISVGIAVIEV
jgi:3-oxoacyl-[acyl-carrier-protein] synthase-3